ncbi:hypothetical protein IWW38_000919 [Coemansia aciculifera]|uniref:Uncharacterized protein n=1 Tax=Coemansia aciculifera TaxID=417176 RepID=A0ACC1M9D7_9FUNG|nr:hypothetical protein IWW38_000919 [Coemansia aciculifera]
MAGNSEDTGSHLKRGRDLDEGADDKRRKPEGGVTKYSARNSSESVEHKLKQSTIGLVKLEEFQRIKGALEEERQRTAANTRITEPTTLDTVSKKPKPAKAKKKVLTFDSDQEEEEDDVVLVSGNKKKKNPFVDTSFLPDKQRDMKDAEHRETLRQQWLESQEAIKQEPITITYSYWDGSGHRRQVRCRKGDTIAQFLEKCRLQVPELRGVRSVDALVYVKEDLIIPHHYSFYDFILNRARGKSGPLFSFDVHEDVRLTQDARVEKDDSHAGKVCERAWYERNRHIFPANRWEVFDAEKNYGSYTIRGNSNKDGSEKK